LIFLFGLCLFGIGIGILTADAKPDGRISAVTLESTTTTTEVTTTTLGSTDVTETSGIP
jgi:hypothetical protein